MKGMAGRSAPARPAPPAPPRPRSRGSAWRSRPAAAVRTSSARLRRVIQTPRRRSGGSGRSARVRCRLEERRGPEPSEPSAKSFSQPTRARPDGSSPRARRCAGRARSPCRGRRPIDAWTRRAAAASASAGVRRERAEGGVGGQAARVVGGDDPERPAAPARPRSARPRGRRSGGGTRTVTSRDAVSWSTPSGLAGRRRDG